MKNLKYYFLLLILFFFSISYVKADSCSREDLAQAKELVKLVEVKYEYSGTVKEEETGLDIDNYTVFINGLTENIDFYVDYHDGNNNFLVYDYEHDFPNGSYSFETTAVDLTIYFEPSNCSADAIRKINLKLKRRNLYADNPRCNQLKEYHLDVCDEWYDGILNDEIFEKAIAKYLVTEEDSNILDSAMDFFNSHLLYFGIGGLVILVIIIFAIYRYRKRSVLE